MDATFLQMLESLHEEKQYREIIDIIEALPQDAQDAESTGLLARAYCNLGQYEYALVLLFSASQPDDFIWNFRVGFAYYFSHQPLQALPYFKQAFIYNPCTEIADYIALCHIAGYANKSHSCIRATKFNAYNNPGYTDARDCQQESSSSDEQPETLPVLTDPPAPEEVPPIQYLPDDAAAVRAHIEQQFGPIGAILPFDSGRTIDIELCICLPTQERNYYTVSTFGMGALPMLLPEKQRPQIPARLELIMTFPPDWEFDLDDERWAWPLRWLLITAYLPFDENTWLSYGHTLSTSADNTPFHDSTKQSSMIIVDLQDQPESATQCTLPAGETVRFLQVLSLYPEELEYKTQYGTAALLRQMSNTEHTICPYRLNTCTPDLLFPPANPSPFVC